MIFDETFSTDSRLSILDTIDFCERMHEGLEYTGPYRPDPRLCQMADEYLHDLMGSAKGRQEVDDF